MSCQYKLNDGTPCRCGELAIKDGVVVGHYDCVGPPGTMCPPAGSAPFQCRICKMPCGDVRDAGRCASCYNMGIVGFNADKVVVEYHINDFMADVINGLGTAERVTAMQKWIWAVTTASAASELAAKRGES